MIAPDRDDLTSPQKASRLVTWKDLTNVSVRRYVNNLKVQIPFRPDTNYQLVIIMVNRRILVYPKLKRIRQAVWDMTVVGLDTLKGNGRVWWRETQSSRDILSAQDRFSSRSYGIRFGVNKR